MNERLADRIRKGDRAAFEAMVREQYAGLLEFATAITKSPVLAEDVIQDVLLNVWEQHARWKPRISERAYLFAAVRNRAYNARRRDKEIRLDAAEATADDSPDEDVHYDELLRDYRRAVAEMPDRRREVFRLSRLYGLTYDEIGEVMGISINTVRSQISAALRYLRDRLSEHLYSILL